MRKTKALAIALLATAHLTPAQALPNAPSFRNFVQDNRFYMAGDLAVRLTDAATTNRFFRLNPSPLLHDQEIPDWIAKHPIRETAFSVGVSGLIDCASWVLYRANHRKLSKIPLLIDIGFDGQADIHNINVLRK